MHSLTLTIMHLSSLEDSRRCYAHIEQFSQSDQINSLQLIVWDGKIGMADRVPITKDHPPPTPQSPHICPPDSNYHSVVVGVFLSQFCKLIWRDLHDPRAEACSVVVRARLG